MNNTLTVSKYIKLYDIFNNLRKTAQINDSDMKKLFIPEGININKNFIFYRLCYSLQNSGAMSNSIKLASSNSSFIENVLQGFDAQKVYNKYSTWEDIYNSLTNYGKNDNGKKEKKETNWQKFAKGIFDGVTFLLKHNGFKIVNDLIQQQCFETNSVKTINDIATQIHGIGLPLTCDWLKECGCQWLVKPDTHIINVYKHLVGLSNNAKVNDSTIIEDMYDWSVEIKNHHDPQMTAYKLDKIIWLICTGNFYQHNIQIGRDLIIKLVK